MEFYALGGHRKNLEPEFAKAASTLKGVVKLVAVDATARRFGAKYGVQGYPTLKMFGLDKRKPEDYQGAREANGTVSGCMKAVNQLVKDRKAGKRARVPLLGRTPVAEVTAQATVGRPRLMSATWSN